MKHNKIMKKISYVIILMALALFLASEANALGISPGRKTVDFEPKLRKEIKLTLHNTEHRDFNAVIFARGELAKYIELSQNSVDFSDDESEKTITYEIFLPENFEKPGVHTAEIVVREIIPDEVGGDMVVGALISVVSEVIVRVPYPNKYAEATFDSESANQGGQVNFFVRVTNLGELDIEKASAFVYIYDLQNNLLSVEKTGEKEVKSTDRKEFFTYWLANASLGSYKATAIVDYDGMLINIDSNFMVGEFFVRPLAISVDKFSLGAINKFNILVENMANEKISDLQAKIKLVDDKNKAVADLTSTPELISPLEKKELIIFWDTADVIEGTYSGALMLSYDGKSIEKSIIMEITENDVKIEIVSITGLAIGGPDEQIVSDFSISMFTRENIFAIGFVIIMLFNVIGFFYIKKIIKNMKK